MFLVRFLTDTPEVGSTLGFLAIVAAAGLHARRTGHWTA